MDKSLSVIMPAWNEVENLEAAVSDTKKILEERRMLYEIIIVTNLDRDGRDDGTTALALKLAAADANHIRHIKNTTWVNLGYKYAEGVKAASYEYVMMVAGDNEDPLSLMINALDLLGKADIVIPYVLNTEVRSLARRFISRIYTLFINALFLLHIPYYNGPVLIRRELVRNLSFSQSFAYMTDIIVTLVKKRRLSYRTVGITLGKRKEGVSKAYRFDNFKTVASDILHLLKKIYFNF